MFDMGFQELLIIGVVALLVIGPERLPGAVRTASLWVAKIRRSLQKIKSEIEDEIDADQLKRDFHNQSIMKSLEKAKNEIQTTVDDIKPDFDQLDYDIKDVIDSPKKSSANADNDSPSSDEVAPKS